jgi:hypothetical protein
MKLSDERVCNGFFNSLLNKKDVNEKFTYLEKVYSNEMSIGNGFKRILIVHLGKETEKTVHPSIIK